MKRIRGLILIVLLGISVFSAYKLFGIFSSYEAAETEYEEVTEIAFSKKEGTVDFTELTAINPEVVGWIQISGTQINYPIVQTNDNDTYLHQTFYREENNAGAIFMDKDNASDFSHSNTIIYGHHMKDGTMFAGLEAYKDDAFLQAHPTFTIITPTGSYEYEVFNVFYGEAEDVAEEVTGDRTEGQVVTLVTCDYSTEDARMSIQGKLI